MKELAQRVLAALLQVERAVACTAFVALVVVIFADVAIRTVWGSGLFWAGEVGVYANIVVVMFGIGLASAANAHLRPRFADHWLPRSWEPFLAHIGELLMALFCLAFAIVAFDLVRETFEFDMRSKVLRIVVWPIQGVIPLVFGLATLRHGLWALWPDLRPEERGALADTQQEQEK